jgi:hypothetical protein
MNRFSLALAVLVTVAMFGLVANPANAGGFGIHFSSPGHCDHYGYPSYHHGYYGGWSGGVGWKGGHVWHDTGHYDYHPGGFVPHGNHFDYVPGHYDYHHTGHWDHW